MDIANLLKDQSLINIINSLLIASESIYCELKKGSGVEIIHTKNTSNDQQIGLDVFADKAFIDALKSGSNCKYILSEEQDKIIEHGIGKYSVSLDPLDGSKSAMVGIPCGAIFGIFKDVDKLKDFNGKNIIASGFFVFGINLEIYLAVHGQVYKGIQIGDEWDFTLVSLMPKSKMIAINTSNKSKWEKWLQDFYVQKTEVDNYNLRWYASMVSEMKRLIIQGGLFAYPNDRRTGYENGHLRLIYEAIPMAYLIHTIGGLSTNGLQSILDLEVNSVHQKTPVYLGDIPTIKTIEKMRKGAN